IIASKVAPRPEGSGFGADQVRRACEASLRRLGIDDLDLYQLHWPDASGVPLEETWEAMAGLADKGLVRAIGVSNFEREQILRCEEIRHVDSLQPEFSMLVLENRELISWCGERGIGTVVYGPLAFGLLSGAITTATSFPEGDWRGQETEGLFAPGNMEANRRVVEALRPIAERLDVSLAQIALAWTIAQPGVTAAIAGSRNPDHARSNTAAGDLELDEKTLGEIETILSSS